MNASLQDTRLDAYMRKLGWALASLPESDRTSIISETRSHVLDRIDSGATLEHALAALGDPIEYGRQFCEAHAVAAALSSRRTPLLVSALVRGAARSMIAAGVGVLILAIWAVAALITYVAILKVSDPTHVGLWVSERFFFIGIIDDPSTGREVLGPWITPVALVSVVIAWLATRALSVFALRAIQPKG